ncbi:MAG: cytochrome c biogenesis CcdA family protein [Lachnospirales bacterium]
MEFFFKRREANYCENMLYFTTFFEGILTFISPCILPMLPIYISYLAGEDNENNVALNAMGFILGFTIVFTMLGLAFALIGSFIRPKVFDYISGTIIIFFGLKYLNIIKLNFNLPIKTFNVNVKNMNFAKAIVFGMAFSFGWTSCLTAFLSTAILTAARGEYFEGITLLLTYSLGLGVPFFISALLINELKGVFSFIKKHYLAINRVSGIFLIVLGILVITGNGLV